MNPRTRLIVVIAAVALAVAILAVALAQCGARTAPATETLGATAEPATPTPTPAPTPTLTREEELVIERQHYSPQSASSADECSDILKTEPWCNVVKDAVRITRPEWEELFPQTEFFLVKYDVYGGEFGPQQRNFLIVEQDGQRYSAETFGGLLDTNNITITDENRELVARAFVLMALSDYLEEEVIFSNWGQVDGPRAFSDLRFNYGITAWTKIQGLEFQWWFLFFQDHLRVTGGEVTEHGTGDYIDVPYWMLPLYADRKYSFWGN